MPPTHTPTLPTLTLHQSNSILNAPCSELHRQIEFCAHICVVYYLPQTALPIEMKELAHPQMHSGLLSFNSQDKCTLVVTIGKPLR